MPGMSRRSLKSLPQPIDSMLLLDIDRPRRAPENALHIIAKAVLAANESAMIGIVGGLAFRFHLRDVIIAEGLKRRKNVVA